MARDLSCVRHRMDVSAVKIPVTKADGEQHSAPQQIDPVFLQLLAALGLIQVPIVPAEQVTMVNSDPSSHMQAPATTQQEAPAGATVAVATQEKTSSTALGDDVDILLAQAIQAAQDNTTGQNLVASALTSNGKSQTDTAVPLAAQTLAEAKADAKGPALKPQVPTVDVKSSPASTSTPDNRVMAENVLQTDRSQGREHAALGGMMDLIGHAAIVQEKRAAAATPASVVATPNASIQLSVNSQTIVEETSAAAQMPEWGAVIESSDLPESGKEHNPASTEHEAWKEGVPQSGGDGAKTMLASTGSSGSPFATIATRSASTSAPASGPTAALPEPSLPASVRFEVQPGDMGRIRVHLSIVDHTVYTNVVTERVEAHDFLVRSSERYESGLAAHGLDVGRFHVDVQGQGREHADHGWSAWRRDDTQRHPSQSPHQPINAWHSDGQRLDWEDRMVNLFA